MSFQQGLSGLNASSKTLEVIGNNVANASTVGFKQSRAQFSDVYANSLQGSGASQIGIGTNLSTVAQQFTQGNITGTSNSLDISINGAGFFQMSNNGTITYSRNGQFQLDKLGHITDAQGKRLTGYQADATGNLNKGKTQDIQVDASDIVPNVTTEIINKVNLDSRNAAKTLAAFNPNDPTTYHNSSAISVFDSLGNPHTVQNFFVKTAPATWDVFSTVDGAPAYTPTAVGPPATTITSNTQIVFTTAGLIQSGGTATINYNPSGASPSAINLDFTGTTQFGSTFSINANNQDGFTSGRLAAFNTGADGVITGRYTNGQSKTLGQVVLANFVNMNGLRPLGGNAWAESSESGAPIIGEPTTGQMGVLQSSSQEDSNVDLTGELVSMITAQRVYQANAQTIKTQDQVLQTLVNLR